MSPEQLTPEEKAVYDLGYHNAMTDADAKLAIAHKALEKGNDKLTLLLSKLRSACEERDVFLAAFTRVSHGEALRGLLSMGYHPPQVHDDPKHQPRVGKKKCTKCSARIVVWEALTPEQKAEKMGITFKAVMQRRADAKLEAGAPAADTPEKPATAPFTHELGGTATPTQAPAES